MIARLAKIAAALIGVGTLLFQSVQGAFGRFNWNFLVPDLVLCVLLLTALFVSDRLRAAILLLIGYSLTAGVFLVATTVALVNDNYNIGALATTVSLIPCVVFIVLLAKWLNEDLSVEQNISAAKK